MKDFRYSTIIIRSFKHLPNFDAYDMINDVKYFCISDIGYLVLK